MALLKDDLETLRRVPMLSGIDSRRLRLLAFTAPRLVYEQGEVLFSKGQDADSAFVILEGSVEILFPIDGKNIRVATLGRYETVGETSLLSGNDRVATVRALEHLEVLKLKRGEFCELLRSSPEMSLAIMAHLAGQLEKTANNYATLKRSTCSDQPQAECSDA